LATTAKVAVNWAKRLTRRALAPEPPRSNHSFRLLPKPRKDGGFILEKVDDFQEWVIETEHESRSLDEEESVRRKGDPGMTVVSLVHYMYFWQYF
jgi:hypothetical protein